MIENTLSPIGQILNTAAERNIPLNTLFELTYRCNLRCSHCYVSDPGGNELSTAEVKTILDQLADAGSLFLTLSGGEVMLRNDLFEICSYARDKSFVLKLFSNGTLIDREAAERLAKAGIVDVGISLYGATAKSHELVTGIPGSFARTISAFGFLREAGVKATAKLLLMKHNIGGYDDAKALSESLGATFIFSYFIGPRLDGSKGPCSLRVTDVDLSRILADGFLYSGVARIPESERVDLRGSTLRELPMCGAGRDTCSISPYADVFPCANLPVNAGNLRQKSFQEVWFGSAGLENLRGAHMADIEKCNECRSIGYCGRCPGFALLEDGNMLGPSSFACWIDNIARMLD